MMQNRVPAIVRGLNEAVPATAFGKNGRPTLAFLVNYKNYLLLVNHVSAPSGEWTLPQEGIGPLENVAQAAIRGLSKELGLHQPAHYVLGGSHSRFFEEGFLNLIPADRTENGEPCVKHTIFLALRSKTDRVRLNPDELQASVWVDGWESFLEHTEAHGKRRPEKFRAIARVLISACVPRTDATGQSYENPFFSWGLPPTELAAFLREQTAVAQ